MRLGIWLLIALLIAWLWRSRSPQGGTGTPPPSGRTTPPKEKPIALAACAYCGLHTSEADEVPGAKGRYCSPAHRDLAER